MAITAVFALNGFLFGSMFSRLPAIQERTDIGDGQLGLALLCSMLGLLGAQILGGALVSRFGSRPLVLFTRPEHAKEIFAGDPEVFHAGKGNAILGPVMGEHSLLLQDSAEHRRARKLLGADLSWSETLNKHRIDIVLWPRGASLTAVLTEAATWQQIYQDDKAAVFIRK